MKGSINSLGQWLVGSLLLFLPQMGLGQLAFAQSFEPLTLPEATASQLWEWTTLSDGIHLVSSAQEPNAQSERYAFFEKQGGYIWGFRYVTHPKAVTICFQDQVTEDERTLEALSTDSQATESEVESEALVTEPLSAVFIDQEGWHFNNAPLDFTGVPFLLETFPTDRTMEDVTAQIALCREVLSDLTVDPSRRLILGVLSYLPLNRTRTLQDGSFFNQHEFRGLAGQRVQISMTSDYFDTYLILVDAMGNTIATDDDTGTDQNALIDIVLPTTGRYQIFANTYDFLSEGDYVLMVTSD